MLIFFFNINFYDIISVTHDINFIINYDYPCGNFAELIYTNRLLNICHNAVEPIAITFFSLEDIENAPKFIDLLKSMKQVINPLLSNLPSLHSMSIMGRIREVNLVSKSTI
jgi:hypothetical protein